MRASWLVVALSLLGLCGGPLRADERDGVELSGTILGGSGQHDLYAVLWDARGFLVTPAQRIRLPAGTKVRYQFKVAPGQWSVSAFEDRNNNGTLDMGMFGPKEPSGFWRAFHAWRKPRFDDVASRVEAATTNADIAIK